MEDTKFQHMNLLVSEPGEITIINFKVVPPFSDEITRIMLKIPLQIIHIQTHLFPS